MKPGVALVAGVVVAAAAAVYFLRWPGACDARLDVPDGLCANVFADDVGPARHVAVAPNGDVYVATWRDGRRTGGVVALRDTNGDGVADLRARFGEEGGAGIAIAPGNLYFATMTTVYRFRLDSAALIPPDPPAIVVTGIPWVDHTARSIAVDGRRLYLNIGAPSNACERNYGQRDFRGANPCHELQTSGGIWLFDALGEGQRPSTSTRFATGLRHTIALGLSPADGRLYGATQGIDHLDRWWPESGYSDHDAANIPSETLFRIDSAGDYGFPYCMHDPRVDRMIVAPAYAGVTSGDHCAALPQPLAAFPAHAAPMALAWPTSAALGPEYEHGVLVALHGSLFHSPDKPRGYAVVFADLRTGQVRPFATARRLGRITGRPSGLAVTRDGGLLIADDAGQRLWIVRRRSRGR